MNEDEEGLLCDIMPRINCIWTKNMYATISRYALCVLLPTVPGQYERDTAGNKKRFYYLFGLIVKAASSNEMTNGDHNMFDFSAALAMRKKGLQSEIEIESESVSVSATERQPQQENQIKEPKLIVNGWGWVAQRAIKSSRPHPTNQRETNFLRPAMEPKINTCVRPFRCRRCEPICCVINSCSIAMSFGVWCLWSMATSHFAEALQRYSP